MTTLIFIGGTICGAAIADGLHVTVQLLGLAVAAVGLLAEGK